MALTACVRKAEPPVSEAPPSAPSDVASIIEPVETIESEPESGDEDIIESEPELAPSGEEAPPKPVPKPEVTLPASAASEASVPAVPPSAQTPVASAAPAPEAGILRAVAPESKLNTEIVERELLRLINELRSQADVSALGVEEGLQFAATTRSTEALKSFSHTRPNGTPYNTAFDEAGFSYAGKWHGENLASLQFTEGMFDEKAIALEMFKGLKNSPGHYQNMVGENFLQIGVGVSLSYSGGLVSVASAQLFSSL